MTEITTNSGFNLSLDETRLNDMEMFDAIVSLEDGDTTQIPRILSLMLGKETKKALYDHCRLPDGRVPIETVYGELHSIFDGLKQPEKK